VKATPVARKIAEGEGIDLSSLSGSGAGGKITKADVLVAASDHGAATQKASVPTGAIDAVASGAKKTTRKKMSPLRRKIATHLVNAQHEAAILTTFNEVDMTAIMDLRKRVQDDFVARHGVKLGFMSFFIKAVVDALQAVPAVNAQIEGDEIIENHFYDIGVAVGTDKGLMVPVIRDCEQKSFAGIEKDIVEYANKARDGKISHADLQGGVFTITNGGIYGSLLSTPILNPPQSGILGMHSIQQRPVALNGQVVIRPMMYLALSYDHRLVDGKEAVTFLVRVKDGLENPERLMLG
jgi:2-oxoglutarate dehydrogenase E2 component (dihydrolipoamide succinyltransferase)